MTQKILAAFVISLFVSCTQTQQAKFSPVIHLYHDPQVGFLNAFLVETENGVVAIDAGFLTYQAAAVRAMVDSLQKPLRAILLTHGHADHYNGATILRGSDDAPIVATKGIDKQIRERDTFYENRFKPEVNELYPNNRTFPTKIVSDNETLIFDDVSFTVHDLGAGESQDDVYWEVKFDDETHSFIGDLVLNRVHAFFQSGHSSDWIASLEELKKIIPEKAKVYPGHGETGTKEMLDWQIDYIRKYREEVRVLAKGQSMMSEEAIEELVKRMQVYLPGERLNFLIPIGANVVAAELAKGQNKIGAKQP